MEQTAKWREDDTSFILCTALSSDDSLEGKKKPSRGGDLHGVCERERLALLLASISGLSVRLSMVSSPMLKAGSELERCALYLHLMWPNRQMLVPAVLSSPDSTNSLNSELLHLFSQK